MQISCQKLLVVFIAVGLCISAEAVPTAPLSHEWEHHFGSVNASNIASRQASDPEWLRILPLGASIVRGLGSDPKDGFRKPLRDKLRSLGYRVNMVGSQNNNYDNPRGSMKDGDHEGHEGAVIDQVYNNVDLSINRKPNLVLINAGTNDCVQNLNIATAHERLGRLVDKIFEKSGQATVILSTLLLNKGDATANANVQIVNNNIRTMVANRRGAGQRIVLAEMNDGRFITAGDLTDAIHPNNYGYRKMAAVWNAAIETASDERLLQTPEDTGISDDAVEEGTCQKVPGDGKGPVKVQQGSGDHDGAYNHRSTSMGRIFTVSAPENSVSDSIFFAQLINVLGNPDRTGALDDLVYWTYPDSSNDGEAAVLVFPNNGGASFPRGVYVNIDIQKDGICERGSVHFGDVNNDGFDDIICIDRNADMYVSIHRGVVDGVPTFAWQGLYHAAPAGYEARHVRFGDIDGDGRLDYCLTHERDGDVHCWRNGGQGDRADYWQDYGVVFKAIGMGDIRGTRLVDLNGDFRSDWVWVGDKGETTIFTNSRGIDAGTAPHWIKATATHGGMNTPGARDRVKFGRIYGGNQVPYGGNRRDYIYIVSSDQGDGNYFHELRAWRNDGEGGTKLRADGNRYCDMTGDGLDDYIWIRSTGEMTMYRNIGQPPNWGQDGIIFNVNRDRKSVHLADWTGDGKCDVLAVEKATGRVEMWENTYGGSGSVTFQYRGWLDSALRCTEGWGVGVFDLGLRFADITGDGKADYLCMNPKGHTTGFLNNWPNGVQDVGQIKFGVEKDRNNHRWADVDGDGRADFLWIDKFDGSTEVWYNNGPVPESDRPANSGSKFKWAPQGKLYNGISRGANQYYPDIDGNGKADMYNVNPVENTADVWYNRCNEGGNGGGDDATSNPDLPPYSPETRFEYATIGDSYASGVSYTGRTHYDNNRVCLRINHAYAQQILNDFPELGAAGDVGALAWPACSGSLLVDMVGGGDENKKEQVKRIDSNRKRLITMHAGGNDAGFFQVAVDCFFHVDPREPYGRYPDPESKCKRSLNAVRTFLTEPYSSGDRSINHRMKNTILDIFNQENGRNIEQLYVLSYPRFFNSETDFCDTYSMAPAFPQTDIWRNTLLTKQLRREMNELTDLFSGAIRDAVGSFGANSRVKFIDISPSYEGHRFCEEGTNWQREHNLADPSPWIWSLTPADILLSQGNQVNEATDDFYSAYSPDSDPSGREQAQAKFNWIDTLSFAKGPNAQAFYTSSNPSNLGPGALFRPFHPTQAGHTAIKELLKARITADFFDRPPSN